MTSAYDAVLAEAKRATGTSARIVRFIGTDHGLVLVHREGYEPWVTWRWAITRTDGSPVAGPTGAMLYSGGYFSDRVAAESDLAARPR